MPFYAVTYRYTDDTAARDEHRPVHREFLASLAGAGALRASGPYVDAEPDSALLIFTADSADEVRDLLADDPFNVNGCIAETTVLQWNPIIGDYADQAGY